MPNLLGRFKVIRVLKMKDKPLDQYTNENNTLKFCLRCGNKMIGYNPFKNGLCNRCVANEEINKDNIIRIS